MRLTWLVSGHSRGSGQIEESKRPIEGLLSKNKKKMGVVNHAENLPILIHQFHAFRLLVTVFLALPAVRARSEYADYCLARG